MDHVNRSHTFLIHLNSAERDLGTTEAPIWNLDDTVSVRLDGYNISVQDVIMPNTVTAVNQFHHSIGITLVPGGTTFHVFKQQNYSAYQIVDYWNTKLGGLIPNGLVTLSFDTQTLKFTFRRPTNTFKLSSKASYNLYSAFGFETSQLDVEATIDPDDPAYYKIEGNIPIDLSGSSYIDINSNFATSNLSSNRQGHLLVRVPVQHSYGTYTFYEPSTDDFNYVSSMQLHEIRMYLYDHEGNPYNPIRDWQITLKCDPIETRTPGHALHSEKTINFY